MHHVMGGKRKENGSLKEPDLKKHMQTHTHHHHQHHHHCYVRESERFITDYNV